MSECTHIEPACLQRYYDGELSCHDQQRIGAHVETCPSCQRELAEFAELTGRVARTFAVQPPDGLTDRFVAASREQQLRKTRRIAWGLAAAAGFLLVSSLLLVQYSQQKDSGAPVYVADWEENIVLPPEVEEDFTDFDTRTLVAIHIPAGGESERENE